MKTIKIEITEEQYESLKSGDLNVALVESEKADDQCGGSDENVIHDVKMEVQEFL